ncbi:uncharacterized protein LOC131600367 [Vicia villosa]|uniref:uncharacterized protein LOC131600367 n=1 Tax=Vicia villosa TaxID=3911 RepID=UPI00273CDA5F|nr:uncharacterized protein LOC131600367 [Vicia villosa]
MGNEDHCKKMVESTTLISDDELDISHNVSPDTQRSGNISLAKYFAGQKGKDLDHNRAQNSENTKRKRSCSVVMSKSDDDDINNLRRRKKKEADDSITEDGHKKEERRSKRVSIRPKYLEDYITTSNVKRS